MACWITTKDLFFLCNSEPSQSITPAFICHKATGMHFLLWTHFNCQVLHLVLSGSSILKGQIDCFFLGPVSSILNPIPISYLLPRYLSLLDQSAYWSWPEHEGNEDVCVCVCVMVKEAGSDLHSSVELPGLGLIVHCSSTHLYNWSKLMPAAFQSAVFLEVSSWSGEMMLGKAVGYLAATGVMWVFTELFHLRRSCVKFD